MEVIIRLLSLLAGPKFAKWVAGFAAAAGGMIALLVARQRGKRLGRAEVRAENARAVARKRAELNAIRERQTKAASNRPETDELGEILGRGKF